MVSSKWPSKIEKLFIGYKDKFRKRHALSVNKSDFEVCDYCN